MLSRIALLVTTVAVAWSLTGAAANAAVPGLPPKGKVLLGVGGWIYPQDFDQQTKHKHHIRQIFMGWNQGDRAYDTWFDDALTGEYRLMFHISTENSGGREQITPRGIARGRGDAWLVRMSKAMNNSGQVIYIRPMAEMNGHWNVYSAFNQNGSHRNAAHSTKSYKNAFRRLTLIMRGGNVAVINRKLKALGLPKLGTAATTLPHSGNIAIVWNPQGEGSPNVRGNQPLDYYPGNRYVDWVANDLYSISSGANWRAQNYMYTTFKNKPFMMAEWAPWGKDDPAYVRAMFKWVASHPRTRALVYFNGTSADTFKLRKKSASLRAYRRLAGAARFICKSACGPLPV
jgi:hypothetical protein